MKVIFLLVYVIYFC